MKEFYSNCFIEAIKAKFKNPKIKITYISPFKNVIFCPHFLWSDGNADYDFVVKRHLKWYEVFWFKGTIREHQLRVTENYKKRIH